MALVVAPVRYPLSSHSIVTLQTALDLADEHEAELTVLHVNPYHTDDRVTRMDLKRAVEGEFGRLDGVRYVVRPGFLVEETILDEIIAEESDYVVIGQKQAPRWRRMVRRLLDDPDIEGYLRQELDCDIVTAAKH